MKIYLVMESGASVIHHAYTIKADADKHVENLKKHTEMECYYVQAIDCD